jgi:hypothetical protein
MSTVRLIQLTLFDLAASLFVGLLVYENPLRWPVLIGFVPILVLINVLACRRIWNYPDGKPVALPIVYACGLLYGIFWTIKSFVWWKLIVLFVPLAFLVRFLILRKRTAPEQGAV